MARWSSREIAELRALYQIQDEESKEADPDNMSTAERSAYMKGMATEAAKSAKQRARH